MKTTPLTTDEIEQIRADTRGAAERIHFNNAGSSLPPDIVVDTVISYLKEEAEFGGYETEHKYKAELENTYTLIARLINASVDEVALVENASVAWGIAFNGVQFSKGDQIITSEVEYATNLIGFLYAQKKHGVEIVVIPNESNGDFSIAALQQAITPKTKLIAITHISSSVGVLMPVAAIGKIARRHGILYLVDACQTAGQAPIDVNEILCDMLSVTGRKYLRAPRGTGFLYVRKAVQHVIEPSTMDGHAVTQLDQNSYTLRLDARRYELYEKNRAITLGLAKAIKYALSIGINRIWDRVQILADSLRQQLKQIEGVTIHDLGSERCGIVTFSIFGYDDYKIKAMLHERGVNISVSPAVSTVIYMGKNNLNTVLRASVHYYNTEEEIDKMCVFLNEIISTLKKGV